MKKICIIVLLIIGLLLMALFIPGNVLAVKCGGAVAAGDTMDEVVRKCGKPVKKEKTKSKDPDATAKKAGRILDKRSNQYKYRDQSKTVEKWHYNCGKNDYIYILTFENGRYQREQTAGRGKGASQCKGIK